VSWQTACPAKTHISSVTTPLSLFWVRDVPNIATSHHPSTLRGNTVGSPLPPPAFAREVKRINTANTPINIQKFAFMLFI
jgi:hypothetical protein